MHGPASIPSMLSDSFITAGKVPSENDILSGARANCASREPLRSPAMNFSYISAHSLGATLAHAAMEPAAP